MLDLHRHRLPNGLSVLICPLPHLRTVELGLYVKAGPRFERPADNGLSHFCEHMLFRGTERHTPFELHTRLETMGGPAVALTGRDHCQYYLSLTRRHTHEALRLLAEIVRRPTWDGIEIERPIILEERLEDLSEGGEDINPETHSRPLLWGDSPLGQPILGPARNIERFGVEDLARHHAETYVGRGGLFYVMGPVNPGEVLQTLGEVMGELPPGEERPLLPTTPVSGSPRLRVVEHEASQDTLLLSFGTGGQSSDDALALSALYTLLADGMTGRLQWTLCEQKGLVYELDAHLDLYHEVGAFDVQLAIGRGRLMTVLKALLELLGELRERPVPEAELAKVKERMRIGLELALDSPGALITRLALPELYGAPLDLEQSLTQVEALTAEDLRALARRVFHRSNLAAVVVGQPARRERRALQEAIHGAWA